MEDNLQDYTLYTPFARLREFYRIPLGGTREEATEEKQHERYPTPSRDEANRATTLALNLRKCVVRLFPPVFHRCIPLYKPLETVLTKIRAGRPLNENSR